MTMKYRTSNAKLKFLLLLLFSLHLFLLIIYLQNIDDTLRKITFT